MLIYDKVVELINQNLSLKRISIVCNCTISELRTFLKNNNLKTKPKVTHPTLKCNFFQNIDTLEKAYWLGFLYADGCIRQLGPKSLRFVLELSQKDDAHLDAFCSAIGLNTKVKRYSTRKNKYHSVYITVFDYTFIENLISKGCGPLKTFRLTLPALQSEELYLAFLLGFYDGDGTVGGSLTSGSEDFLKAIKDKYLIESSIYSVKNSNTYTLYLPVSIKRKMFDSYSKSLIRKRVINRN